MTDSLERGDQVPHFQVRTVTGDVFTYAAVWQRNNLVLVTLPEDAADSSYLSSLAAQSPDFERHESAYVITRDRIPGIPTPGALVADRWGEIVHVAAPSHVADLPTPAELLDWLDYLEQRCPECEGEAM